MDVRRDVIERLEADGVDYFVTGSEALAALGVAYRATNDIDIVEDPDARAARSASERWITAQRLWAAIDEAGITDDGGRARFIAGRLWPDMPGSWVEAFVARTRERALAGHHLERPSKVEDVVGPRLAGLMRAHGFPTDLG